MSAHKPCCPYCDSSAYVVVGKEVVECKRCEFGWNRYRGPRVDTARPPVKAGFWKKTTG